MASMVFLEYGGLDISDEDVFYHRELDGAAQLTGDCKRGRRTAHQQCLRKGPSMCIEGGPNPGKGRGFLPEYVWTADSPADCQRPHWPACRWRQTPLRCLGLYKMHCWAALLPHLSSLRAKGLHVSAGHALLSRWQGKLTSHPNSHKAELAAWRMERSTG